MGRGRREGWWQVSDSWLHFVGFGFGFSFGCGPHLVVVDATLALYSGLLPVAFRGSLNARDQTPLVC